MWYGAGFRHGYGHGYWGSWWGRGLAWGLGAWALGSVFYDSGYGGGDYSNPYYAPEEQATGTYADYSVPLQTDYQAVAAAATSTNATSVVAPPGSEHIDPAREAFKNGNYTLAMQELDKALQKLPKDAALHELRGLIFFAQGNYPSAAGTLYAVLQAGPGWDWTTLSSLYPSTETYTTQLRVLEDYVRANPRSAEARFVLAYHYITCGHTNPAITQLKEVLGLKPQDQLSAYLLKTLTKTSGAASASATPPSAEASADSAVENPATAGLPDIEGSKLVGTWTGQRAKDPTRFTLTLTTDGKFTWGYQRNGKGNSFGGKYTTEGPMLMLERQDGASMPGIIKMTTTGFNFKLFGSPDTDQGLDFRK